MTDIDSGALSDGVAEAKTTIIAADYMYLIFIGGSNIIKNIADKLNNDIDLDKLNDNKSNKIESSNASNVSNVPNRSYRSKNKLKCQETYVGCSIGNPCIEMLEDEEIYKIIVKDATETAKNKGLIKDKTIADTSDNLNDSKYSDSGSKENSSDKNTDDTYETDETDEEIIDEENIDEEINEVNEIIDDVDDEIDDVDEVVEIDDQKSSLSEEEALIIDNHKKYVVLDEGVETAQCFTFANISANDNILKNNDIGNLTMLMVMNRFDTHYKLSFPVLQLEEEENPDRLISRWLKDHRAEEIVKEITIRPVEVVKNEHDILVYTAFIHK